MRVAGRVDDGVADVGRRGNGRSHCGVKRNFVEAGGGVDVAREESVTADAQVAVGVQGPTFAIEGEGHAVVLGDP